MVMPMIVSVTVTVTVSVTPTYYVGARVIIFLILNNNPTEAWA